MGMVKTRNQQRPEMKKSEGVMKPQKTAKKMILPTVHFPRPNSLDLASCLSPLERRPGRPSKLSVSSGVVSTLSLLRPIKERLMSVGPKEQATFLKITSLPSFVLGDAATFAGVFLHVRFVVFEHDIFAERVEDVASELP